MPAHTSGSLTATGSVTLTKPGADTHVVVAVDGTYGTVNYVFEGSLDGTNFAPLAAQLLSTGVVVTGTVVPADNAELLYVIAAPALVSVRLRVTAIASGTVGVNLVSGSWIGLPAAPVNNSAVTASAGLTSTSGSAGIGYATGAGGTVTQASSITTGVTLNKVTGQITTVAATTAAGAEDTFTVTNSAVAATDTVVCSTTYAGAGLPLVYCSKVAAGSFNVTISNLHASAALDALLVINFTVVKGVTS